MKKKQHILIAEDEAVNRMLLRKILEEEYVVSEVSDGAGVLRALKESGDSFTAVVLDLIMPGMDGFEVLKKSPRCRSSPIFRFWWPPAEAVRTARHRALPPARGIM